MSRGARHWGNGGLGRSPRSARREPDRRAAGFRSPACPDRRRRTRQESERGASELTGEIEIHDRRRAAEVSGGRRRRDGIIAAEQPRYPAGVVAATVSRISFHRPGLRGLNASVNQRSIVLSASGSSEFARRTVLIRSSHAAAAPAGLAGKVSLQSAEISLAPCSIASAWPIMPPIDRPI